MSKPVRVRIAKSGGDKALTVRRADVAIGNNKWMDRRHAEQRGGRPDEQRSDEAVTSLTKRTHTAPALRSASWRTPDAPIVRITVTINALASSGG